MSMRVVVLRGLVVVLVVAASALSLALHVGESPIWWVELLRYIPYPVWLLPTVAGIGLAWPLGLRWRLTALLAPLLIAMVVMDLRWGRPDADGQMPLRLMTWNIKAYVAEDTHRGYQPILDELRAQDPDVVVMQDAHGVNEASHRLVAPMLAYVQSWPARFQHGQYVILSRHPLRECAIHDLRVAEDPADFVSCVVETPGGALDLATLHLVSPRDGLNATRHERLRGLQSWRENLAERWGQALRVAAWKAARPGDRPLVLAGDFNAPEASPVMQRLEQGLRNVWGRAGIGWGYTHGHSLRPHISFLRIDHILVDERLGIRGVSVGSKDASDHRPVIADLWLRRAP